MKNKKISNQKMSDYIILNNNSTTESANDAITDDPLQLSKNLQRLMLKY